MDSNAQVFPPDGIGVQAGQDDSEVFRVMSVGGTAPTLAGPIFMKMWIKNFGLNPLIDQYQHFGFWSAGLGSELISMTLHWQLPLGNPVWQLKIGAFMTQGLIFAYVPGDLEWLLQYDGSDYILSDANGIQSLGSAGANPATPLEELLIDQTDEMPGDAMTLARIYAGRTFPTV